MTLLKGGCHNPQTPPLNTLLIERKFVEGI